MLPVVTALLVAHSRAEEAEVYPAARDEAGEADEVEHSQAEHVEAEEILTNWPAWTLATRGTRRRSRSSSTR